MYKLIVVFQNNTKLEEMYNESELREKLSNGVRGIVKWANVITPSGCTKSVTELISK